MRRLLGLALITALLPACSGTEEGRTIVASIYPLAFAADHIAGPEWDVIDLTVSGAEAHDVELTIDQRSAIQDAAVVLYLGDIGFQPQVEEAVQEASGVIGTPDVIGPSSDGVPDPHFWLSPSLMADAGADIANALRRADPDAALHLDAFSIQMDALQKRYASALNVCRYRTMIVSHEAFGYLASEFNLRQFGLSGVTPEAEPSVSRLAQARELVNAGEAGAVFYEQHEDAQRVAKAFASDAGVPALPLHTLETHPGFSDYIEVMDELNLKSLREGLACR